MELISAGYSAGDAERRVGEPAKRQARTAFQRDRARVLHSAAFRRLSAKTQVVGPASSDSVRNRLTHSLEVAQVARELGQELGCDPDVVETAALAHDLGHPPFGHNGERALDRAAASVGGFEGNAQTLRVLTRLEPKTLDAQGRSVGLNLTRAALDACCKYPWPRAGAPPTSGSHADGTPRELRKFGVYADDLPVFGWLRTGVAEPRRCLEAQVMDLADDIAYSVHDIEDAVVSGRVDLGALRCGGERLGVFAAVRDWYLPGADDALLTDALQRLTGLPAWPRERHDGGLRASVQLKALTSTLIGRFCALVRTATHDAYGSGELTRYACDLVLPGEVSAEIAVLKGIAAHFVMRREDRVDLLREQRALLAGLVEGLTSRPEDLAPAFGEAHSAATDDASRLRVVIDAVASLTDASAVASMHRLTG